MKSACFYPAIAFAAAAALFATGCSVFPVPVGKCTYGKEPDLHGRVIIKSVEKVYSGKQPNYRIHVEGFFKRDFVYSGDEFRTKFTLKGYKAGSELEGVISPGGPCPPMYRIAD